MTASWLYAAPTKMQLSIHLDRVHTSHRLRA
ncbi:hypothetical protein EV650_3529 [Kribbella kalugense]|uniref:Uncharacterized protein n=1 Tax=Kribbella kalugense TaxID=2512221 RepID=A0A4R8A578_9ACTN|nr:hypothetical protein EV650_3529 [Kribbella kalugense]